MSRPRTASDVEKAVDEASTVLLPIGHYETALDGWRKRASSHAALPEPDIVCAPDLSATKRQHSSLGDAEALIAKHFRLAKFALFGETFQLTVTRPGCEFSGTLVPETVEPPSGVPTVTEDVVKAWHDHGHHMGLSDSDGAVDFLNVRPSTWNSRSIEASEISVSKNLTKYVEDQWDAHFYPGHVTAVPWKIIVSGPGAYVDRYREPPMPGLVGRCLIGVGDFVRASGELQWHGHDGMLLVEGSDQAFRTKPGEMVACYSDTSIEITTVDEGYSAVLLYHIFDVRTWTAASPDAPTPTASVPPRAELQADLQRLAGLLSSVTRPYGIFLAHEYSLESMAFFGVDSILTIAARQIEGAEVHVIPVASRFVAHAIIDMDSDHTTHEQVKAPVVPLTRAYIEAVLDAVGDSDGSDASDDDDDDYDLLKTGDLVPPGGELWLKGLKDVPFYRFQTGEAFEDPTRSSMHSEAERPTQPSSLSPVSAAYLMYAVIILPQT